MSDSDCDDFTSINELPDEHSEEAALARRVKHKIMHDTDDDHDSNDDADDEMPDKPRRAARPVSSWYARLRARFFDLIIVFILIVFLTWPSVQDVIEQFLGKSSTVFPVLAKAALGTLSYFMIREFLDQKKVF